MQVKQLTLTGEVLDYLPSPPPKKANPPVYKYIVVFEVNGYQELEKVYIQDCTRDGMGAYERAGLAAMHQTPFEQVHNIRTIKKEETAKSVENSDEWRVDAINGR